MADKVYGDFTQEELDWQYNNRERVPDHETLLTKYVARGEAFIAKAPHTFDIPFGDTPAEVLDVYPAHESDDAAPVLIFFHGGYWFSRHKNDFRYIPVGFAPAGAMVVVVNYALVPDVDLPELVRQCRASVAWTCKNAAEHGGDPNRIYISGHSAGGHITAMMNATDWSEWDVDPGAIKGSMAISGLYDLEPIRLNYMNPTLGFTPEIVSTLSPIHLKPTVNAPIVFAVGGAETPEFHRHNKMLSGPWAQAGMACEEITVPDLNHFTILEDFSTEGRTLNTRMRQMMGL
ncbi:MAG: alpha/beta hydrolase [Rhodospirillales bacterium]|nr:alpha/beta hydrolase [Rhodospirillales bacterium]MBO6788789.1 alpha/beta hydrolase [Rhodospirillales bacterium]